MMQRIQTAVSLPVQEQRLVRNREQRALQRREDVQLIVRPLDRRQSRPQRLHLFPAMKRFRPRQQMRHSARLQRPHHLPREIDLAVVSLSEQNRDIAFAVSPFALVAEHPCDECRNRLRQRLRQSLLRQPCLIRLRNRQHDHAGPVPGSGRGRAPKVPIRRARPPRFRSFPFQTRHSQIVECLERNDNSA